MYMLFTGAPPFKGNSNKEIITKVQDGVISFTGKRWENISIIAVDLLKKMLIYNPKLRISASKALADPWFKYFENPKGDQKTEMIHCITALKEFQTSSIMKRAVLAFMAARIIDKKEERKLKAVFQHLDTNNNGTLSLNEIIEGCKSVFGEDNEIAKQNAQKIMEYNDINKTGEIDYNGYS